VLVAGAALVLAGGWAWWVSADPEIEVQPAQTTPPVVVAEEVAPQQVENGLEGALPEFDNTVRREVGRMEPGATHVLHVPSEKNGDYRLQYVCLGPGDLTVRIEGTVAGEMLHQVDCEGSLSVFPFVAEGTRVVIEVHRPGPEPAEVGIQVFGVG
jgi:hypothetical protein